MKASFERRVVNGLVWIVCGILIIAIRALVLQSASLLAWILLGGGMVAFGAFRLIWALVRRAPKRESE